jgi:hypothetical protein
MYSRYEYIYESEGFQKLLLGQRNFDLAGAPRQIIRTPDSGVQRGQPAPPSLGTVSEGHETWKFPIRFPTRAEELQLLFKPLAHAPQIRGKRNPRHAAQLLGQRQCRSLGALQFIDLANLQAVAGSLETTELSIRTQLSDTVKPVFEPQLSEAFACKLSTVSAYLRLEVASRSIQSQTFSVDFKPDWRTRGVSIANETATTLAACRPVVEALVDGDSVSAFSNGKISNASVVLESPDYVSVFSLYSLNFGGLGLNSPVTGSARVVLTARGHNSRAFPHLRISEK